MRPIRARGGCQTLSELSDPYCFQSLSYSCPHALTGNHVLRGGMAAAPLRAQRVVRDLNIAGPPKSNPFANNIPTAAVACGTDSSLLIPALPISLYS